MHDVTFADNANKTINIIWITDLHLDAAARSLYRNLVDLINTHQPKSVLVGGDISNGPTSLMHLKYLSETIQKPLYFVLGNHDFYYGSIPKVRERAHLLSEEHPDIRYLTDSGLAGLTKKTGLIGHDGWSDGRAGDYFHSDVELNDYYLIDELKELSPEDRLQKLHELGSEAAESIRKILPQALKKYQHVILLTHVPPFEEACLYHGRPCDPNWAPHFVCQALGEALVDIMQNYPDKQLLVLCGHSHSPADVQILPNLRVLTGGSELGSPQIQGIIHIA